MTTTPLPPLDWVAMLKDAIRIVKSKPTYKRFIDGTPLDNDVPVWMADFAMQHATQARADLEAENARLRKIAWLIGSIFVHGNFKAETGNERELEKLLRENGTFWESLADFDARSTLERKP